MFAKLAKLQAFGSGRAASMPSLVHANDNRPETRRSGAASQSQRPALGCRWRRAPGDGRLECCWHIEPGDDALGDEPGESPALSRLRTLIDTYRYPVTQRALSECNRRDLPAV
jgi:hypothetical protein